MELPTMLSAFCVALFLLLAHCESVQVNIVESPPEHGSHQVIQSEFTMPVLSRKMKLKVASSNAFADKDHMPQKLFKSSSGEKVHKDENVMKQEASTKVAKGADRIDASTYYKSSEDFTMDYRGVRKRRPIHNKIPFSP